MTKTRLLSCALLAPALLLTCRHVPPEPELMRLQAAAAEVTIVRDTFGVPHIYGPTDASVVFGLAYARAEDQFPLVEQYYAESLGRLSEILGPDHLVYDLLVRAMELERHARAEYERLPPELAALCRGFADGINLYLRTHPEVRRRVFDRFEPWFPLAGDRNFWSLYSLRNSPQRFGLRPDDLLARLSAAAPASTTPPSGSPGSGGQGCNAWAIAPSRSTTGHTMLLIDVHIALEPTYEFHLHSDEGLHVAGFANYGSGILPVSGFNERLGWMLTENAPDWVDLYLETFDDPAQPLAYRYGDGYRQAEEWADTVAVKTASGLERRSITFRRTHHGPILAERGGRQVALRVAGLSEGGILGQFYAMARARNLTEFQRALERNALSNQHLVYADADGNIYYVYNGLIPRRDPRIDWEAPVDGSDPATEWQGVHPLAERPQLLNPPDGFVQGCNGSPFLAAASDNLDPAAFPPYMVGAADRDNTRARRARQLLGRERPFSFEEFGQLPANSYLLEAAERLPALLAAWRALPTDDPLRRRLASPVAVLEGWDYIARVDSVPATLFLDWFERMFVPASRGKPAPEPLTTLAEVLTGLEAEWGTWRVPWGDVNRLQRVPRSQDAALPSGFSDDRPSLPAAGATGWAGTVNVFAGPKATGSRHRYGVFGRANTAVVEFGATVRAQSVTPFGVSFDPASPHFFDQAPLYAAGGLKPMWFDRAELADNAERGYHPGEGR